MKLLRPLTELQRAMFDDCMSFMEDYHLREKGKAMGAKTKAVAGVIAQATVRYILRKKSR